MDVRHLFIGGLATDYCVKSTVLDAPKNDFVRGVNKNPNDSSKAVKEMKAAGAMISTSHEIIMSLSRRKSRQGRKADA
jgi:nicotinamidase/pyrazinamidase